MHPPLTALENRVGRSNSGRRTDNRPGFVVRPTAFGGVGTGIEFGVKRLVLLRGILRQPGVPVTYFFNGD